jgi:hypothetical protein
MAESVAPALRALLLHLIDYAGLFPPASLSLEAALSYYEAYAAGPHSWMLGRFVIPAAQIRSLDENATSQLSVLSDADHPRASAIEAKTIIATPKPTYCEVSLDELPDVKSIGAFAKMRTGGVTPESIPSVEAVANFILTSARLRLPFKATAGLHHPVRSLRPLTYEQDAPRIMMHGFLNVFVAAAFAWYGMEKIEPILAEQDPNTFRFDTAVHWRDYSLSADQVQAARTHFAHSFGSCSFEEPVQDLQALGWL